VKIVEDVAAVIGVVFVAYCGWRLLVIGHDLGEKLRGKREELVSIFKNSEKSK
jgi:hypothetical protein